MAEILVCTWMLVGFLGYIMTAVGLLYAIAGHGCGLLFNKHAWWVGVHYSAHNRRFCINVLPCVTLWVIKDGGTPPTK